MKFLGIFTALIGAFIFVDLIYSSIKLLIIRNKKNKNDKKKLLKKGIKMDIISIVMYFLGFGLCYCGFMLGII